MPLEQNRKYFLLLPVTAALLCAAAGNLAWLLLESAATRLGGAAAAPATDGLYVTLLFLQLGYFGAAAPLVHRAGMQCLEGVAQQLDAGATQLPAIRERFAPGRGSGLRRALLPALVLTVALQEVQFARFTDWWASPDWALGELWTVLASWGTWSTALWLIARVIADVTALRRLGEHCVVIDLMRIEPLVAFSRYGLQLTSLVVGIIALWAISAVVLSAVLTPGGTDTSGQIVLFMLVIYLGITLAAFVYPQLGIRRNMRRQKQRVAEQITGQLPVAQHGALDTDTADQLAALLAVRTHIQSLPDWPIGQHTRIRLALYLFIPLLSWVAAALVEELVSRFLL